MNIHLRKFSFIYYKHKSKNSSFLRFLPQTNNYLLSGKGFKEINHFISIYFIAETILAQQISFLPNFFA